MFPPFVHVFFGGASPKMADSKENFLREHGSISGLDKYFNHRRFLPLSSVFGCVSHRLRRIFTLS